MLVIFPPRPRLIMRRAASRPTSPRAEPVTRPVLPLKSNSLDDILFFLKATSTDMQVWTIKDRRLKIEAQAHPFHGVHKPVLDLRNGCDKFLIPARVESAYCLLDKSIGLAERRVHRGGETDRTSAIMGCERPMPRFRQRRDLAAFRQASGPAQIHHSDMNGVALQKLLIRPSRAERLTGANPDIRGTCVFRKR